MQSGVVRMSSASPRMRCNLDWKTAADTAAPTGGLGMRSQGVGIATGPAPMLARFGQMRSAVRGCALTFAGWHLRSTFHQSSFWRGAEQNTRPLRQPPSRKVTACREARASQGGACALRTVNSISRWRNGISGRLIHRNPLTIRQEVPRLASCQTQRAGSLPRFGSRDVLSAADPPFAKATVRQAQPPLCRFADGRTQAFALWVNGYQATIKRASSRVSGATACQGGPTCAGAAAVAESYGVTSLHQITARQASRDDGQPAAI